MADQGSEGLLSPWLRRARFNAVKSYLKGNILDFGCGTGHLASFIQPSCYLGVEIDSVSLRKARSNYPAHTFASSLDGVVRYFDTIVSLAVIEHVSDPVRFLTELKSRLATSQEACLVITTPHPSFDWVHDTGAAFGLFSRHANEEHEELLNQDRLLDTARQCGLSLSLYERFLLGANQLAVFRRLT